MSDAQRNTQENVISLHSRASRAHDPLPDQNICSVHTLQGTVIDGTQVLMDIEDRRTIAFNINTIHACLQDLVRLEASPDVYAAELQRIEPAIRAYDEFCPPLKRVHAEAPITGPDVWLTPVQLMAAKRLLTLTQDLRFKLSDAVMQWQRSTTIATQVALVRQELFPARALHPVRKYANNHSLRHVVIYAANPEFEVTRCENLIITARQSINAGEPTQARRGLDEVANIRSLHDSVQKLFDERYVLEAIETASPSKNLEEPR